MQHHDLRKCGLRQTGRYWTPSRLRRPWAQPLVYLHIDDVASLYTLAVDTAPAGSFAYVESGEAALGELVKATARRFGLSEPRSLPADEAIALLGREVAVFALGSNSRVRGELARERLGWRPEHHSILDWIGSEAEVRTR